MPGERGRTRKDPMPPKSKPATGLFVERSSGETVKHTGTLSYAKKVTTGGRIGGKTTLTR